MKLLFRTAKDFVKSVEETCTIRSIEQYDPFKIHKSWILDKYL